MSAVANWDWTVLVRLLWFSEVCNMETGFAIFTLAVMGLLLGMIHVTRQAKQQWKAELVPGIRLRMTPTCP